MTAKDALRTVMLGGVAWNTMVYFDEFPAPQPATVFSRRSYETVGSSGAGKALNMRYLGADVTLWGLLGDDTAGRLVREFIASRGIRFIEDRDPQGTMRHINLMNQRGERISIWANAGSHEFAIDMAKIIDPIRHADIVSVTIANYCRQFLPLLSEMGKEVWIDIHDYDGANPYHAEFIEAADYLLMSSLLMEDWRSFLERRVAAGTKVALCTHGTAGASGVAAGSGWCDLPAIAVDDVVDTNGAGDAFFAGFASQWARDPDLEKAMRRGVQVAAAAVQSPELAPL